MTDPTSDVATLSKWVGRSETMVETISAAWCTKLGHTLGRDGSLADGDVLPPLWHFVAHLTSMPHGRLGRDGHPERGGFLPPVALPRRMWAGGRFAFHADIHLGDEVTKVSTITSVAMKEGRTGPLCFVTVQHELAVDGQLRIAEEQDLVYRDDPHPGAPIPSPQLAPTDGDFSRVVTPDAALLFRYSALTFNAHRIHYDRDYSRDVEGYPGLVFHGPLTATLLADLAVAETGRRLATFSFRAMSPLFDTDPFTIAGMRDSDNMTLWATTPSGGMAMRATAELAGPSALS